MQKFYNSSNFNKSYEDNIENTRYLIFEYVTHFIFMAVPVSKVPPNHDFTIDSVTPVVSMHKNKEEEEDYELVGSFEVITEHPKNEEDYDGKTRYKYIVQLELGKNWIHWSCPDAPPIFT